MRPRMLIAIAIAIAFTGAVESAHAAKLYAAPDGTGSQPCFRADPCPLRVAVGAGNSGDEVVATRGRYDLGSEDLDVNSDINLHGPRRGRPARIVVAAGSAIAAFMDGRIADLVIENTAGAGFFPSFDAPTLERLRVLASSAAPACYLPQTPGVLRDSICVNRGTGPGIGASIGGGGQPITFSHDVINVTALATSVNANGAYLAAGGMVTVEGRITNSILIGGGSAADLATERSTPNTSTVDAVLRNSSLDDSSQGAGTTITYAGGNLLEPPAFVDQGAFDLRQLARSPTVDRGIATPAFGELGSFDFEGERRRVGRRPDIGADEFSGILEVSARRRQRASRLRFTALCPLTGCRLKVTGEGVRTKRARLRAGSAKVIGLELREPGSVPSRLGLRISALDRTGFRETDRLPIRLR